MPTPAVWGPSARAQVQFCIPHLARTLHGICMYEMPRTDNTDMEAITVKWN
jgi:hypothetical protein